MLYSDIISKLKEELTDDILFTSRLEPFGHCRCDDFSSRNGVCNFEFFWCEWWNYLANSFAEQSDKMKKPEFKLAPARHDDNSMGDYTYIRDITLDGVYVGDIYPSKYDQDINLAIVRGAEGPLIMALRAWFNDHRNQYKVKEQIAADARFAESMALRKTKADAANDAFAKYE